ncbi:MIP aquaporin [Aspergillus mulundensis]|uniref:MIP aquaporin n=1 Tax=Aspergillus mulundensis TaxID=1810919 RepID=A0A3D8Q9M8_9EURO|nr:MIP aquaporin [Aspergillus mulundensis]RDW58543.1 MIP aquaporin [Aspergillus mulundensis]
MHLPTAIKKLRPSSWQPQAADTDTRPHAGKIKRRSTMGMGLTQLPSLSVPDTARNNFTAMAGEFVGTFLFLFFAFAGTQIANAPRSRAPELDQAGGGKVAPPDFDALLYSSLSFGFSLMVNIWAFFRITGGLFNPAVTLALCLIGGIPAVRGLLLLIAQIGGGLAAAAIVSVLLPGDLNVATRLGGGASVIQGLFIETILTAQLVFVVIMLAVVKHKSTFLAPVAIGMTFFVMEMIGNYYTGGSLNPARTLGPDVLLRSFPSYHWIYWAGPFLGSLIACAFYTFLTHFQYEAVNPGQDFNEWEAKALHPLGHGHGPTMSGSTMNMSMSLPTTNPVPNMHRYSDMTLNRDFSLREVPDEDAADMTSAQAHASALAALVGGPSTVPAGAGGSIRPSATGSVRSTTNSNSRPSLTVTRAASTYSFPVVPVGDEAV